MRIKCEYNPNLGIEETFKRVKEKMDDIKKNNPLINYLEFGNPSINYIPEIHYRMSINGDLCGYSLDGEIMIKNISELELKIKKHPFIFFVSNPFKELTKEKIENLFKQ